MPKHACIVACRTHATQCNRATELDARGTDAAGTLHARVCSARRSAYAEAQPSHVGRSHQRCAHRRSAEPFRHCCGAIRRTDPANAQSEAVKTARSAARRRPSLSASALRLCLDRALLALGLGPKHSVSRPHSLAPLLAEPARPPVPAVAPTASGASASFRRLRCAVAAALQRSAPSSHR